MRTPRWLPIVSVLAALSITSFPGQSHAASPSRRSASNPRARALELFEQSAAAYREGRFQDTIDLLLEARRIKREAVLLYNIGRAYEALGNLKEAANAYEDYLNEEPGAADRRALETRIATLRAQASELEKARALPSPVEAKPLPPEPPQPPPSLPPAPPPASAPAPASQTSTAIPWMVTGIGVVGLGAGVVFGLLADARHRSAMDEPQQQEAQRKQGEARALATGATVELIAGGAITLAGVAWLTSLVLKPARVNVVAGPASIGLRGTF